MKPIEERKTDFYNKVGQQFMGQYSKEMLNDFCSYWGEYSEGGRKMRFEMQKVFDISRRLGTWSRNSQKFNNGNSTTDKKSIQEQAASIAKWDGE